MDKPCTVSVEQLDDNGLGEVVEDAWNMLQDGTQAPPAGVGRELQCVECGQGIGVLKESFTACVLCDKLVHCCKDCIDRHMGEHSVDQFFGGLVQRKLRQSRTQKETGPLPSTTMSAGAAASSQSRGFSDPDADEDQMNLCIAETRVRRGCESTESSEEGGLDLTPWCSGCGNERCRRNAGECTRLEKIERLLVLIQALSRESDSIMLVQYPKIEDRALYMACT